MGLPGSVTIVSISHDQVAAAVGAGAFDGDVAVDGAGTVECLTPIYDGKIIRINIPPLTEERRKELVKVGRKYAEDARIAVRNVRRDANDSLKKLEKGKEISEDERKKAEEDVQELTNKYVAEIDKHFQEKEKEILAI